MKLKLQVQESIVHGLLVDEQAACVDNIIHVMHFVRRLLFVHIWFPCVFLLWTWLVRSVEISRLVERSAPSPLDQPIEELSFCPLNRIVEFSCSEGDNSSSRYHFAVFFKNPLAHFVADSSGGSKTTAQTFLGRGKGLCGFPEIAPRIPFKFPEVGNVSSFSSNLSLRHLPMELE